MDLVGNGAHWARAAQDLRAASVTVVQSLTGTQPEGGLGGRISEMTDGRRARVLIADQVEQGT